MKNSYHGIKFIALALLASVLSGAGAHAKTFADPGAMCQIAAQAAEKRHGIQAGLLHAIGQIESGRQDGSTGDAAPWPWTISAEGRGRYFPTLKAAMVEVMALQARGVTSIDVGCMQINLYFHGAAFEDLADAFMPDRNADYAARFLKTLYADTGDWREAVGRYHSATLKRKRAYSEKVMATWLPDRAPQAYAALPKEFGDLNPSDYRALKVAQYLARRASRNALD